MGGWVAQGTLGLTLTMYSTPNTAAPQDPIPGAAPAQHLQPVHHPHGPAPVLRALPKSYLPIQRGPGPKP